MTSFQGTAWRLLEPKTTFYSPRYSQETLSVRHQVLPFYNQPQTILQLGESEFLVLSSIPQDAIKRSGDAKETKKLLQLTVRPLDDVSRAQLYQTATRTQILELFVDVEHTREQLLRCLRRDEATEPGKKLLDDAFAALEKGQKSEGREMALKLYKEAEKGFYEAEKVVPDDRSRELLRVRRGDLQRTIRGLEEEEKILSVVVEATEMNISARLEELRRFAAEEATRNEPEKTSDLTERLAALKNEKAGPASPVDELTERLRRLRGDKGSTGVVRVEGGKSAVDRIIEQVTDEIALGIEDDEFDEELDSDDVSSKSSESSESSKSSKDSDGQSNVKK